MLMLCISLKSPAKKSNIYKNCTVKDCITNFNSTVVADLKSYSKMIECNQTSQSKDIVKARKKLRKRIISHLLSSDNESLANKSAPVIDAVAIRIEAEVFKVASSCTKCSLQLEKYINCDSKLFQKRLSNVCRIMIARIKRKRRKNEVVLL